MKREIREELKKDQEKSERWTGLKNVAAATGLAVAGVAVTWLGGLYVKRFLARS